MRATPAKSAKRYGGLSDRELLKISTTIAKSRQIKENTLHDLTEQLELSSPEQSVLEQSVTARHPPAKHSDLLDDAPLAVVEAFLVQDLIYVLLGIEGQFIRFSPDYSPDDEYDRSQGARYIIDSDIDASLSSLVARITPLATYYTAILAFIDANSHLEAGLTNHALCAALRTILKDYKILVAQLEDQYASNVSFSLQQFWYHIQDTLHTLELVYKLALDLAPPLETASSSDEDEESGDEMEQVLKAMGAASTSTGWRAGGEVKGGEVLAVIEEAILRHSGDPSAVALYSSLFLQASQPYAASLLRWTTTGQLYDPYDEFMIRDTRSITRGTLEQDYVDEYWDRKYTLKDSPVTSSTHTHETQRAPTPLVTKTREKARAEGKGGGAIVPSCLEPVKNKILLAGKYLNVIKEAGKSEYVELQPSIEGDVALNDEAFYDRIDRAYAIANKALLQVLIQDQHLHSRLRSLRYHFFQSHGDVMVHFLDLASVELNKKAKHVSLTKLQNFLDYALRNTSSVSSEDPWKEDVGVAMHRERLADFLTTINNVTGAIGGEETKKDKEAEEAKPPLGFETVLLSYTVEFPLSLVISKNAILNYQLIFRHLFNLKHLELSLTSMWVEQCKSPIWRHHPSHPSLEKWKARVHVLRSRMLAFIQHTYAYCSNDVLEKNWRKMMDKLDNGVVSVDELLRLHSDMLQSCVKECMLMDNKLIKIQQKMILCCSLFANHKNRLASIVSNVNKAVDTGRADEVTMEEEDKILKRFELNFYKYQTTHQDVVKLATMSDNAALAAYTNRLKSSVPPSVSGSIL